MNMCSMLLLGSALMFSCGLYADETGDADDLQSGVLNFKEETPLSPKPSGEWLSKDGSLTCDGYLTRNADEDFCAAEIPDDWRSIEFNGKTYYVQPLA